MGPVKGIQAGDAPPLQKQISNRGRLVHHPRFQEGHLETGNGLAGSSSDSQDSKYGIIGREIQSLPYLPQPGLSVEWEKFFTSRRKGSNSFGVRRIG